MPTFLFSKFDVLIFKSASKNKRILNQYLILSPGMSFLSDLILFLLLSVFIGTPVFSEMTDKLSPFFTM
jgi:hypothetical protein